MLKTITEATALINEKKLLHIAGKGEPEGKKLGGLYGPIAFGEIAWQLMNQTLVYLRVESMGFQI